MKKLILSTVVTLIVFQFAGAQSNLVLTNGAKMILSSASYLVNTNDVTIQSGATLTNNGNINVKGNFTNNGTSSVGTGLIAFNGTVTQTIGGITPTGFGQMNANNNIQLNTPATISSALTFQSGKITLGSSDLTIGNSGSISGYDNTKYVNAGGTGRLIQNVAAANKVYPVGTTATYVPVTLNNSGTADSYGVHVFDDVQNNGTSGGTIASINHAVDMTWVVDEGTAGGSNLTATCQWNLSNEGSLFTRMQSGIGVYSSGAWIPQNAGAASGSNPYTLTRTGITAPGPMAVGDVNTPMAITVALTVNLKEFLEGPFTGTEMTTFLNSGALIPLSQPYNGAPWNYAGAENVISIPNGNMVDWVLVELRDALSAPQATIGTRIARQAGFLLKNGQIVGMDGSSPLQFNVNVTNQLFAIVWYKNHLGVMSSVGLTNVGGTYSYDFTTSATQVYGGANGHKQIGSGIWGMISGDGDANGTVNSSDESVIWTLYAGKLGYHPSDFNLNGQTNNTDKNERWFPNIGKTTLIP
jgi:hypothetical protein